ncbi:NACHT domain-containing protein [Nostoc sp. UHCC 0870]|uniref:NACHT domain-containing protein n=1 Tax=Nostoc sp. UHCC 0870 TaxID=2914041 RepID=UPI001EDE76D4|nr:NACHT domain-containing protein [Nostoc sp. UHCC 0870]UKO97105.1 NACHT domain-containing protein [Nostoc sp. UHCC 0870]
MPDFFFLWGLSGASLVFKPILEKLAILAKDAIKDSLGDYIKEFFGVFLKSNLDLAQELSLRIAFGQALKEFLNLVEIQLGDFDITDNEIKNYEIYIEKFIDDKNILQQLGIPFQEALGNQQYIEVKIFADTWRNLNLKELPEKFNWQQLSSQYTRKVKTIVKNSDNLREILNSTLLSDIKDTVEGLAPIAPNFDFTRYRQGLLDAYQKLKMNSLDTSAYNYDVNLWDIFVPQNLEQTEAAINSISVLDIVNKPQDYKYTLILGNPGSGKSTLSQYTALKWATLKARDLVTQELPLLIELGNYSANLDNLDGEKFLGYLHRGDGVKGGNLDRRELDTWLTSHNSIVIFDGLDEVLDQGRRKQITTDIINFKNTYPQSRILITSRIVGYDNQQFTQANFRHFRLQDLDSEQIKGFIEQWHNLTFKDKDDGNRKRDRLLACINFAPFKELVGNPLLLTMMAILNRHEDLPRDRATLYDNSAKLLLQRWDQEKPVPPVDKGNIKLDYFHKKQILRHIACRIQGNRHVNPHNLFIDANAIEEIISQYLNSKGFEKARENAISLREELTSRSFILCFFGGDNYGFVHRTFLEYFCAYHFIYAFQTEQSLTLPEIQQDIIVAHWKDEAWREVIILIAGILVEEHTGKLIECLMTQDGEANGFENLIIAADCLRNARSRYPIKTIDDQLLNTLKNLVKNQQNISDKICEKLNAVIQATWIDN